MSESARTRARGPPARGTALLIVALASILAVLPFAAASGPAVPHPYASYDTGQVAIVLPTAHPTVELVEDANSAVNAVLSATSVVELSPSASSYRVVAAATPTTGTPFNGSRPAGATSPWAVSLAAELPVVQGAVDRSSLTGRAPGPSAAVTTGIAELRVDFAPGPSTSTGPSLLLRWSVADWPLANASDLLGVVFHFDAAGASGFVRCESANALAGSDCTGGPLGGATDSWDASAVGAEAEGSNGAIAALGWGSASTNGTAAPSAVGWQANQTGGIDLALAAPSNPTVTAGAVDFALSSPTRLPAPVEALGSGPVYLIAGALAAGGALGGLALYRDRDERIAREL